MTSNYPSVSSVWCRGWLPSLVCVCTLVVCAQRPASATVRADCPEVVREAGACEEEPRDEQPDTGAGLVEQDEPATDTSPPIGRDLRLSRFFARLGRSFYRLGESENIRPAAIAAGGSGLMALLDDPINDRVSGERRVLQELGDFGATLNSVVLGGTYSGLLLTGHFTGHTELYSTSQSLLQGLIVTQTIVQVTKRAVGRARPNMENQRSFPSGHTADMVMTATIAGHRLGKKVGIPVTILATVVAASRIEKHVHWASDVAAGAGIGYIVGRTVLRSNGLFVRRTRSQVLWTPVVQPRRVGMSVNW